MSRRFFPLGIVGVGLASALSACALQPNSFPSGAQKGAARALGIYTTALLEDQEDQTYQALARDAIRRENRFLEAVEPERVLGSIRPSQTELEAGVYSTEEIFQIGAQIFHTTFTPEMGFGAKDLPKLARFQKGHRGGPDAMRCDSCHWRGGPGGAGDAADNAYLQGDGDRQSTSLARNPPSLAGAGVVELLAREMTAELQATREKLLAQAKKEGKPARERLSAKGVSFGELEARPNGSIDGTALEGVDFDLVVKPFGWKGHFASLRDVVEDELATHHGLLTTALVKAADPERVGPFGGTDPDGDGVVDEVVEGQVTALSLFLAMQEVPIAEPPVDQDQIVLLAKGQSLFTTLGCAGCHTPSLELSSTKYTLSSREGGSRLSVDLATAAAEPRIRPISTGGAAPVFLYSDLKRHDMGDALAESKIDRGVGQRFFLTRPLWGVARSRPYLHDARTPMLEEAILAHGGEAESARSAFVALSEPERAGVRVFLTSLTRARRLLVP